MQTDEIARILPPIKIGKIVTVDSRPRFIVVKPTLYSDISEFFFVKSQFKIIKLLPAGPNFRKVRNIYILIFM